MNLQESTENLEESNLFNQEPHKEQQRYRKLKVLGQGSMGKVYLVEETSSHLPFVMKRIHIGHLPQAARDAALRQAQLHSVLSHPNIIQFKQIYHTTGDKLCIIMEYAEGGDLDEWIRAQNGKPIQEDAIIKIFSQICLGLREVHQKKIVHRDLKGANIFLSKDQNVKIGDFGISKSLDRTVLASKSFVGTPYYLSPEMVQGKPYSTKSDIWSLGVILYHLCAQKLPFQAISLPVLALKILKGSFPPLTGNNYSKQMKALILSMLQVDAKRRPSAEQILNKPFINKFIPKQEQQKCKANLLANKPKPKAVQQKKALETVQSPPIKHQIKGQKVKISEKQIKDALKEQEFKQRERLKKEQQIKKREELRKNMREDLKLKRKQTQKTEKNYESVPQAKKLHQKSIKTLSTEAKSFEETASKAQLNTVKPWKAKKQVRQSKSKDITIEIFVPQAKLKQQKKQQPQINNNFKIEIYEGKKPVVNTEGDKSPQSKISQSKRQIPPTISQNAVQNYHYSQKNINMGDEDEEEQEIEQSPDLMDLLSNVRAANQLAANLKNPYGEIELYEESDNFDNTVGIINAPLKNEQQELEELEDLLFVTKSQNLQELRLIVEEKLGDDNFIQAYNIIKDYFDEFNQKKANPTNSEENDLKSHIYNPTLLRSKLPFLTDKQFESSVQLLYAIVVLQDSQMSSNGGENYISMLNQ